MVLKLNQCILVAQKVKKIGFIYYLVTVFEKSIYNNANGHIIIKYYGLNIQWMEINVWDYMMTPMMMDIIMKMRHIEQIVTLLLQFVSIYVVVISIYVNYALINHDSSFAIYVIEYVMIKYVTDVVIRHVYIV
jgi:hypothetical protein